MATMDGIDRLPGPFRHQRGPYFYTAAGVRLVNGRTLWVKDVVDDDDWLRATSSRGRDLLLSRARVKAVEAA